MSSNSCELNLAAATILSQARQCLIRDGWTKETYQDWRGRHCMIGALHHVFQTDTTTQAYLQALAFLLGGLGGAIPEKLGLVHSGLITGYNDRVCQSLEGDVLPWIDRAIKLAIDAYDQEQVAVPDPPVEDSELVLA